jgi:hypothetical protein
MRRSISHIYHKNIKIALTKYRNISNYLIKEKIFKMILGS